PCHPFFAHFANALAYLHSFPTRRSSDLRRLDRPGLHGPSMHDRGSDPGNRSRPRQTSRRDQINGISQPVQTLERTRSERSRCPADRKSTRLNSSHVSISYAVFCLKKKK